VESPDENPEAVVVVIVLPAEPQFPVMGFAPSFEWQFLDGNECRASAYCIKYRLTMFIPTITG
jgi:hypothetical protein